MPLSLNTDLIDPIYCNYNDPGPPLVDIVLFRLSRVSPQSFKTCMLGEGFHTWCSILLSNQCRTSQSTPLLGPMSSLVLVPFSNRGGTPAKSTPLGPSPLLAHCLMSTPLLGTARRLTHHSVSGSNTICNSSGPPLTDIVLFELSLSSFPSRF